MPKRTFRYRYRIAGLTLLAASFLNPSLMAQSGTGSIHGLVTDSTGAVIPGAGRDTSGWTGRRPKATTTAADGTWSFAAVPGGNYTVRLEFSGFTSADVALTVQDGKTFDTTTQLTPVGTNQQITVSGGPGPELSLDPGNNASTVSISGSDLDALPDDPDDLNDMLTQLAGPGAGMNGTPADLHGRLLRRPASGEGRH